VQTSVNAKISSKSDPGFQSGLPDQSGSASGCLRDLSQNVVDFHYLVSVSHFATFCKNWAVIVRNANKSCKIRYPAMVRKMEN